MSRPIALAMPPVGFQSIHGDNTIRVDSTSSIVIVGANGSGKTRLGNWLEFNGPQKLKVYRIGAQKSLSFPQEVSPTSLLNSRVNLHYGINSTSLDNYLKQAGGIEQNLHVYKAGYKWNDNPATSLLDDFSPLLIYLFTDDYELSTKYRKDSLTNPGIPVPATILDRVTAVWTQVLPHRQLNISAGQVTAQIIGVESTPYKALEMSDGERVTFYLIGQCLSAPLDSVIVVDEPEIHLHRVIQARLWDAIEKERPDCLFVYLTHDLEFATSRTEAKKIWIKSFDGKVWDWKEVPPEQDGLPEEVLLAVLGSRKPVLFVEGGKDSLDRAILSRIYPDWTIMPREGCEKVIEATKAFRDLKYLHGLECVGIIDRDYRSQQQQTDLLIKGIYVLDIQEMENLLLVEPVLQAVAAHPHVRTMTDNTAPDIVQKVKEFAFTTLQRDITSLALSKTAWELEENLHKIERQVKSVAELETVRDKAAQFDVAGIYAAFEQKLQQIIATTDYGTLLQLYNNKGLAKQVGKYFGQQSYPDLVRRLISSGEGEAIVDALRAAAPQLPSVAIGA